MSETMKTYVALILDKSGSMSNMRDVAINNFNEQLQALQQESNSPEAEAKKVLIADNPEDVSQGVETKVSVITFNEKLDEVYFDVDINEVKEITHDDYQPNGTTALYDAIGITIDKFMQHYDLSDSNSGVLFVIITDGQENSSQNYKGEEGRKIIKSKIDELNASGKWTFTFMGTEQALDAVQDFDMNKLAYDYSAQGLCASNDAHVNAMRGYFDTRKMLKTCSVQDFYHNKGDVQDSTEQSNT